jgi:hypothetical protein
LNTNFTQQPKTNILVKKLHTLKFGPAFLAVAGPDTIKTKTLLKNTRKIGYFFFAQFSIPPTKKTSKNHPKTIKKRPL